MEAFPGPGAIRSTLSATAWAENSRANGTARRVPGVGHRRALDGRVLVLAIVTTKARMFFTTKAQRGL